jgi:flagellar basal body-associated protein FliL
VTYNNNKNKNKIIIIIIIIIMSVVPSGTQVVYKSSPAVSAPGDKPEITAAVLPTFIQCSSSQAVT